MQIDADMLIRILSFLFSVAAALFTWSQAKNKAGAEALKELEGKLTAARAETAAVASKCSELEGELKHMPDKETVHRIELSMKDMQALIGAQGEALKSYTSTMQRLEEYLLRLPAPQTAVRRK